MEAAAESAPPPPGGVAEALRLAQAFFRTVSGADPTPLGTSRPMVEDGLASVDAQVFLVYAAVVFTLNWGMRMLLVEPVARVALVGPGGKPATRAKVQKFAQSAMEMVTYGAFALVGLMIVPTQDFAWPSSRWWVDFSSGSHATMRDDLRCYYVLYAARYFQGAICVFMEHKRKDFVEMQVHHWVTVALVWISYVYGWNRIGVIVMFLLDPADVPLHTAKLCKYVSEARAGDARAVARWTFGADRLFEIFAVTFFITRLVMYPYVCWSAHVEATRYFPKGAPEWTCVALLETLLVLQVYWFYLILKVAVKLIMTGSVEDVRSDDEDDDADANPIATKKAD